MKKKGLASLIGATGLYFAKDHISEAVGKLLGDSLQATSYNLTISSMKFSSTGTSPFHREMVESVGKYWISQLKPYHMQLGENAVALCATILGSIGIGYLFAYLATKDWG